MKKFFAFMLVVAMLSVAGIACAATSITASPTAVTVERGTSATATVTGTAGYRGNLAYEKVSGPAWATFSGTTVTFNPPSTEEVGVYEVIISVTETYTGPEAGHSGTATESAQVVIPVTVTAPAKTDGGSEAAQQTTTVVQKVVATVVAEVKVVKVELAVVVTSQDIKKESKNATAVEETKSAIITALKALSSALANLIQDTAEVKKPDNIIVIESPNYDPAPTEEASKKNLEKAAARLQQRPRSQNKRAAGFVPPLKAATSGLQPFDLPPFKKSFFGKKPGLDLGKRETRVANSFFAADADGNEEAVFLDSTGAPTDVVPGTDDNGTVHGNASADEGVVTAIVYVEEGAEYEPIITVEVSSADEASFDAANTDTVASVDVATVTYDAVIVNATNSFNPAVDDVVQAAIGTIYGKSLDELPYTAASTTATWVATADEKSYMTANDLVFVCSLPVMNSLDLKDGAYIAQIMFDNTPSGDQISAPAFYANGVSEGGASKSTVYVASGDAFVALTNGKSIKNGLIGYLVFEVASGALVTASDFEAAAFNISKPALAVKAAATEPTPGPTPTPTTSDDEAVIAYYSKYINALTRTIRDEGFAQKPSFSSAYPNGTVILNFPVRASSWKVMLQGYDTPITPSSTLAIGSITNNTTTQATITFVPSEINVGFSSSAIERTITLYVNPVSGDKEADAVTATLGTITGTKEGAAPGDFGIGSSSSGCSAGSAALALALLGAFIATRKK